MQETVKAAAVAADRRAPDGGSLNHGGFDALFEEVSPLFRRDDAIAFGNLESPIAPSSDGGVRPFVFDGPPEVLDALKAIGFEVLSCANNHAYDQGRAGLTETLEEVRKAGLASVGAGADHASARAPLILERNGLRLGFLAYTTRLNDNLNGAREQLPEVNFADPARMEADIKALAPHVDAVIVSLHWGVEYAVAPEAEQVALAHRLIDAGALLLLGSHPHVLMRLERYGSKGSLIAYSLGNFISNQSRHYVAGVDPVEDGDPRDGIALAITLERSGSGVKIVSAGYRPIWTENNGNSHEKDPQVPAVIRLIRTEREPELWKIRQPRYDLRLGGAVELDVGAAGR
jgi:poly-gamma-glutamate synthesis protein (capsule biosynthesis protein)